MLVQHGFIRRYSVDGVAVIQVIKFKEHQSPHNTEKASTLPDYNPNRIDNKQQLGLTVNPPLNVSEITEPKRPDSLIPDSLNTDSLIPDCGISDSNESSIPNLSGVVAKKRDITPVKKTEEPITRQTWKAYAEAYFIRYGADPVRNATVTGQLAQFVKRIGQDESPHVASFYVHHNNQFYVQKMHTVGLLLADAEKLRTEWATKRTVTNTQARQVDRKQTTANVFNQLIDEQRVAKNARN